MNQQYNNTTFCSSNFRNDNSIEIWNVLHAAFLERVIPGRAESSVEAVCWVADRLLSVGLSGTGIIEWDLKTLTAKRKLLLVGESGICIDKHETKELVAVGTEEGIINILSTSYDDLQFSKLLDRQDNGIICCKFDTSGEKLVSGGIDSVKIWNLSTGQVIHKMSTGRSDSCQPTMVWCVDILDNFTIVSGDSRGRIVFWDGEIGAQIDYIHASSSDIMCLAVSEDKQTFFCSGMEQIIRQFSKVKSNDGKQQWVRSMKRSKLHTHDVMALTTIRDGIASGGIDGFLTISTRDLKNFHRFGPFLQGSIANLSRESRLMLMRYVNYLEIWQLAKPGKLQDDHSVVESLIKFNANQSIKEKETSYEIDRHPEKLVELHSKGNEMIICSAVSNDGNWLVYSTESTCRLFCLKVQENDKPKLQSMRSTPEEFQPCSQVLFSNDSKKLFCLRKSSLITFNLYSDGFEHKDTVELSEHHSDRIHLVDLSSCSKYLAIASLCHNVSIWHFQRSKWNCIKTLPKYRCPTTTLKIDSDRKRLALVYADYHFLEVNLDNLLIEHSSTLSDVNHGNASIATPIVDLQFAPKNRDIMLFRRDDAISSIKPTAEKQSKINKSSNENRAQKETTLIKKFDDVSE